MKSRDNPGLRKKKLLGQTRALAGLLILIGMAFLLVFLNYGLYWLPILAVILFALNEVFASDHIFYNPGNDYHYSLSPDKVFSLRLTDGKNESRLQTEGQSISPGTDLATWLLPVTLAPKLSGKIYDPYVTILCGNYRNRQYFERGAQGRRYINLTSAIGNDASRIENVRLIFKHCGAKNQSVELMRFDHPDFSRKRILIIAPHADDAEIAAFGLYSRTDDIHIVTLTAGEMEAGLFRHVYAKPAMASRLKGRLRAWDSMAIPLWGGVSQEKCINLGYFCMTLKNMHDAPDRPVTSKTADIKDTRYFRTFNQTKLQSDAHGEATWISLVSDLKEVISRIKPEVIVMNDQVLDPHQDHIYATFAVEQALNELAFKPQHLLYYANHYKHTDMHPFGPAHTIASLAPQFEGKAVSGKICSIFCTPDTQKNKVYALEMMHDLKKAGKPWKKKIRVWLQSWITRRPVNPYGENEYFRKAIRENELFFVRKVEQDDSEA